MEQDDAFSFAQLRKNNIALHFEILQRNFIDVKRILTALSIESNEMHRLINRVLHKQEAHRSDEKIDALTADLVILLDLLAATRRKTLQSIIRKRFNEFSNSRNSKYVI